MAFNKATTMSSQFRSMYSYRSVDGSLTGYTCYSNKYGGEKYAFVKVDLEMTYALRSVDFWTDPTKLGEYTQLENSYLIV